MRKSNSRTPQRTTSPKRSGATNLRSAAWLLRGISAIPGELALSADRISFTAHGPGSAWDWQLRKLEQHARMAKFATLVRTGSRAVLFDAKLLETEITFPWYYFSGGLVVKTRDDVYKLSFGRPANSPRAGVHGGPTRAAAELREVGSMRTTGKLWREALLKAETSRNPNHEDSRID